MKPAKTQAALAKALGGLGLKITQQALSKHVARGNLPSGPPWDPQACYEALKQRRTAGSTEKTEKLRLIRERRMKLRDERRILHREYIPRAEAEGKWADICTVIRGEFVNLPESGVVTAIRQAGTEHEAKAILQGRVFEILSRLSGDGKAD